MPRLPGFDVGDVRLDGPAVLAALAGYSDLPYRLLCRRMGAALCHTEMLLDRMLLEPKVRRRLVQLAPADHPLAAQLIGNDPPTMAAAAAVLGEMGADVVDLNFACPVRKALRRRRGGWLLNDPDRALAIVRAVVAATDRPVTVKIRRSFRQADRSAAAFWRIVEGALAAGASALCVHARSVEVKYAGPADWAFLAEARRQLPEATLIGSGDVHAPADVFRMREATGVDGVAVARGALGNPWFFRQVADVAAGRAPRQPSLAEQRRLLAEHFDSACALYGPDKAARHMRKFGIRYARLHPRPRAVRAAFVAVRHPADWRAVLDRYYEPVSATDTEVQYRFASEGRDIGARFR